MSFSLAVLLGGVLALEQLNDRANSFATADRRCSHLAPNGVDSPERSRCLDRELDRKGVRWLDVVLAPAVILGVGLGVGAAVGPRQVWPASDVGQARP